MYGLYCNRISSEDEGTMNLPTDNLPPHGRRHADMEEYAKVTWPGIEKILQKVEGMIGKA